MKLSLTPVFYAAVMLFCLIDPASRALRTVLAAPVLRWLGGLGYGLYVLHPLALMAAVRLPQGNQSGLPGQQARRRLQHHLQHGVQV